MEPVLAAAGTTWRASDFEKRRAHWHSFNVIFTLTYLGIILDLVTTRIGFGIAGSGYEQNPIGALLIDHVGWWGLLFVLTLFCFLCYTSCRVVFFHLPRKWILILNGALAVLATVRWVVVATALMFIFH